MSAVSFPRRPAPWERGVAWNDAARARGTPAARTASTRIERGRCRPGGAKGLEVSPCGLGQDHLVERQIRHCATKPGVLRLKVLQPFHLIRFQPAKLLTPPIVSDLGDADRANGVGHRLSLRDQYVDLSKLRDDLFWLMTLSRHCGPPPCPKTYFKVDQFGGGGSMLQDLWIKHRDRVFEPIYDSSVDALVGSINRALPSDQLTPFVEKLARRIASFPAHAIAHAKAAVDAGAFSSMAEGLLVEAHESDLSVASEVTQARVAEALKVGAETYEGELEMGYLSRLSPIQD